MKKITNSLFKGLNGWRSGLLGACLLMGPALMAQTGTIAIGSGTGASATALPVSTYFGYSYSQQIIPAATFIANGGAAGDITTIRYYVDWAEVPLEAWNEWTIYMGHTTKTAFASTTDWVPVADLTEVFTGTITAVDEEWMEITFTTPFTYDGVSNIVVAVDENNEDYADDYTYFGSYSATNLGLYHRSDSVNADPETPPTGVRTSTVPRLQLVGAVQSCLKPTALVSPSVGAFTATIGWTASQSTPSGGYEYYYATSNTAPDDDTEPEGTVAAGVLTANLADLDASTQYYFWVRSNCGTDGFSSWSNAGTFTTLPSCVVPTALTVSGFNPASVSVNWTASVSTPANGYQYIYATTSTVPTASSAPSGTVPAGATSATLTGLNPDTVYYVWVRSDCGSDDYSAWTSSISFRTDCPALAPTTAFETFADYTGSMPAPICWREAKGVLGASPIALTGTVSDWTNENYNNATSANGRAARINLYSSTQKGDWIVSPALDLGTGTDYQLEYTVSVLPWTGSTPVASMGDHFVKVVVSTDGGATWSEDNVIATYDNDNIPAGGINEAVQLTGYSGIIKVGIFAYSQGTTPDLRFYLDNARVVEVPSCIKPTGLQFSGVTTTTATLAWNPVSPAPAEGYEYYISQTNTAPDAATIGTPVAGTTATPAVIGATTYYVWVRSVCAANDKSEWSSSVTFTTPCEPSNVPYVLDFENVTVPALPVCTANQNVGTGNNWTTNSPNAYGFTTKVLRYSFNGSNAANTWFITNGINLTGGVTYKISYDYGNAGSTTFVEKMKVAYGTTNSAAGMNTILADHPSIVNNVTPINNVVEFTPATTGVYYFGFNAYSAINRHNLYVDNIKVDSALANGEFNLDSFAYYPNPVKDVLNLKYASEITSVSVYNLVGQQVIAKQINANETAVDMSSLPQGAYIVNVAAGEYVKTIKVIKN